MVMFLDIVDKMFVKTPITTAIQEATCKGASYNIERHPHSKPKI